MVLMNELAHVSGKPGLYRIVKPTRSGVIVETLDDKKSRIVMGANARVSVLKDISVYTTTDEGATPLPVIFFALHTKYGTAIEIDTRKASENELRQVLADAYPEYDAARVYPTDIKKMLNWFGIIGQFAPEALVPAEEAPTEETAS